MSKMRCIFLLTPGGGPGILAQVESLRRSSGLDARIILADSNPASGNLFLPEIDDRFRVPPCSDYRFVEALAGLLLREGVDYWYSGLDEELPVIARHRGVFEAAGCRLLLPPVEALEAALDKKRTHVLTEKVVLTPRTVFLSLGDDLDVLWDAFEGRLLFKLVNSRGGRGIFIPHDFDEHRLYSLRVRKRMREGARFMAQELVRGDEYNVSMLHDHAGVPLYAVSRRKFETREVKSTTTAAVIESNQAVIDQALAVVAAMGLYPGFNNVETILSKNDGRPYFIEINGGRAAAQDMNLVAAGIPMMDMMVDLAEGRHLEPIPHPADGTAILKIRKDVVVSWADITNMPEAK
jgi:carbamoyl-phosphate synthase large subunit